MGTEAGTWIEAWSRKEASTITLTCLQIRMTKAENIKKVVSGIESVTARAKQSQRPSHMGAIHK